MLSQQHFLGRCFHIRDPSLESGSRSLIPLAATRGDGSPRARGEGGEEGRGSCPRTACSIRPSDDGEMVYAVHSLKLVRGGDTRAKRTLSMCPNIYYTAVCIHSRRYGRRAVPEPLDVKGKLSREKVWSQSDDSGRLAYSTPRRAWSNISHAPPPSTSDDCTPS